MIVVTALDSTILALMLSKGDQINGYNILKIPTVANKDRYCINRISAHIRIRVLKQARELGERCRLGNLRPDIF
jgi:hypothetical protein